MFLYVSTIIICMIIISVVNLLVSMPLFDYAWWFSPLAVIVCTVGAIVIDGIFATLIRWALPEKWFGLDKKGYSAKKRESIFYEKIGIKKWKDKVLELGGFTNFHKDKLADPTDNEYVKRFIIESNYGVSIHIACIIFGFLVVFLFPLKYWLCFGVPVAVVNGVLNALTLFILRYNLPKLHTLYKLNLRREKKRQAKVEQDCAVTQN